MIFPLPMIFAAWGFRNGAAVWQNAAQLANLCTLNRIPTVAVQQGLDEYGRPATDRADADTLRNAGLRVLVWGVASTANAYQELQRLGADETTDWLPQIEGPDQRDLVLDAAMDGLEPAAIVTNYSGAGDTADDAEQLRDAGVETVLVECYNDAGPIEPYIDLDRMLWQGTAYGWQMSELVAVMGTYHGEMPDTYSAVDGRRFGLYLAEPMSSSQWTAFGALNPSPPTPEDEEVEPVTDQQALDSHKTASQAAIQNYTDPKPRGRNTIIWRIANADDTSWNAARDSVKADLDEAGVPDIPD